MSADYARADDRHSKLRSALEGSPRRFREGAGPRGSVRSWDSASARGWYHFENIRTSNVRGARPDPLFVLQGPGLLLMPMVAYKLLNGGREPSSWYTRPENARSWRIGRREYVAVDVKDLYDLAADNCRDDFLTRAEGARNAAEGLEIACFGLGILGRTWEPLPLFEALQAAGLAAREESDALNAKLRAESEKAWPPAPGTYATRNTPIASAAQRLLQDREGRPAEADYPGRPARVLSVSGDTAQVREWKYGGGVEEREMDKEEWVSCLFAPAEDEPGL